MKFQKLEVFEKHFKEAYPDHLSAVYVVIASEENERKKILNSLIRILEKGGDVKRCQEVKEATAHLSCPSLFAERVVAYFEGAHLVLKEEIELLKKYLLSPSPDACLLLGAENDKQISALYKEGKKEMVILDLTKEKPWEEKARLEKWAVQLFRQEKKEISPQVLSYFLSLLPQDRLLIEQEIHKLVCHALGKTTISREDIETLCVPQVELNAFHFAQELVWGRSTSIPPLQDVATLLPLIGILRSQFEIGLKMGALLKKGANPQEIGEAFPRLWPKALEQCLRGTREKGESYFKKGLRALFDLELGLKTSRGKPAALFTAFCGQLVQLDKSF